MIFKNCHFSLQKKNDPAMVRIVERRGGVCIMLLLYANPTEKSIVKYYENENYFWY